MIDMRVAGGVLLLALVALVVVYLVPGGEVGGHCGAGVGGGVVGVEGAIA